MEADCRPFLIAGFNAHHLVTNVLVLPAHYKTPGALPAISSQAAQMVNSSYITHLSATYTAVSRFSKRSGLAAELGA
jgi:hypothetical protein